MGEKAWMSISQFTGLGKGGGVGGTTPPPAENGSAATGGDAHESVPGHGQGIAGGEIGGRC